MAKQGRELQGKKKKLPKSEISVCYYTQNECWLLLLEGSPLFPAAVATLTAL